MKEIIDIVISGNPKLHGLLGQVISEVSKICFLNKEEELVLSDCIKTACSYIAHTSYEGDLNQRISITILIIENKQLEFRLYDSGNPIKNPQDLKKKLVACQTKDFKLDVIDYKAFGEGNMITLVKKLTIETLRYSSKPIDGSETMLLSSLLNINLGLNHNQPLDELLYTIVKNVKKLMNCEGVSVIFLNKKHNELVFHTAISENKMDEQKLKGTTLVADKGIIGEVIKTGESIIVNETKNIPHYFDKITGKKTISLLYSPIRSQNEIIGVLSAQNKKRGNFNTKDLKKLNVIATTVALSISNAHANEAIQECSRLKKELHSARMLHQATLPQSIPDIKGLDISAACIPAVEVGGDYYDILKLESASYAFAVGDVSGHGLEAGMMVSMAHSCLYTELNYSHSITDVMKAMNRIIYGGVKKRLIMTFFYGEYNLNTRRLQFCNAGHPSPFYYSYHKKKWQVIDNGEFPLGIFENHKYKIYAKQLYSKDILVFFSDGIIESMNSSGEFYGLKRLYALLQSKKWKNAEQIKKNILASVNNFAQYYPSKDDQTLLIIYFT